MAAFTADESGEAYEALIHEYIEQSYTGHPTCEQVSATCRAYLARVFSSTRIDHSLRNENFQLNFTTSVLPYEYPKKTKTIAALTKAFAFNLIKRDLLGKVFTRAHFTVLPHPENSPIKNRWDSLPTFQVELSQANFRQSLMGTGSIPLVLEGESSIAGSPPGHHLDGGLLDYHFDVAQSGVPILYPHFSCSPVPGWLDRFAPGRTCGESFKDWLCLVVPSESMLEKFGLQEYPNRHHFHKLSNTERKRVWRHTARETEKMEAELALCLEAGELLKWSEPLL